METQPNKNETVDYVDTTRLSRVSASGVKFPPSATRYEQSASPEVGIARELFYDQSPVDRRQGKKNPVHVNSDPEEGKKTNEGVVLPRKQKKESAGEG